MGQRIINVDEKALAALHLLREQLDTVASVLNDLSDMGLVVKFQFGANPQGKQVISVFEVLAPFNINQ